jgi:nicotinamidase/pyrazinamidase
MRSPNEALIVIDVQNDFCPGGALAVTGGNEIVAGINALMDDFASVILTQDWHPAGHSSFASTHNADPFTTYEAPYGTQVLWPDHCIQGTDGAAFHPALNTHGDLIIRKGYNSAIDSYSAFFENDKTTPTGLAGYLRARGIDTLIIVGLALDYCVNYSAQDAAKLGFKTTVLTDLCRAIDASSEATARTEMKALGVVIK